MQSEVHRKDRLGSPAATRKLRRTHLALGSVFVAERASDPDKHTRSATGYSRVRRIAIATNLTLQSIDNEFFYSVNIVDNQMRWGFWAAR